MRELLCVAMLDPLLRIWCNIAQDIICPNAWHVTYYIDLLRLLTLEKQDIDQEQGGGWVECEPLSLQAHLNHLQLWYFLIHINIKTSYVTGSGMSLFIPFISMHIDLMYSHSGVRNVKNALHQTQRTPLSTFPMRSYIHPSKRRSRPSSAHLPSCDKKRMSRSWSFCSNWRIGHLAWFIWFCRVASNIMLNATQMA